MRIKPAAILRISSFGRQPIRVPSHYVFLLITEEMASSSFLKPALNDAAWFSTTAGEILSV
jgi:hypothetical protein